MRQRKWVKVSAERSYQEEKGFPLQTYRVEMGGEKKAVGNFTFFIILILLAHFATYSGCFNVALHAQVSPSGSNPIVGSVITTDGLKEALKRRKDVDYVKIFYPSHYDGFLDHVWDLILIEGYFQSIHEFLRLSRNNFPLVKIIFYCLDPEYPGLTAVRQFDVDGLLTNSQKLLDKEKYNVIPGIPNELLLLAANEVVMKPNRSISRDWGTVFVGAGGGMLEHKPKLYQMLLDSLPYKLRLHGGSWEGVEVLRDFWQGSLPQHDIPNAYASAHTVLASTISSQEKYGMINNRIFEAMACGSVVITPYAPSLYDFVGDRILYINDSYTVMQHLENTIADEARSESMRQEARNFILEGHTWSHRVVELVDFYYHLKHTKSTHAFARGERQMLKTTYVTNVRSGSGRSGRGNGHVCGVNQCTRTSCPRLLWIVSDPLTRHQDYTFVAASKGSEYLCDRFAVTFLSQQQWMDKIITHCAYAPTITRKLWVQGDFSSHRPHSSGTAPTKSCTNFLSQFEVILTFVTPYDELDLSVRRLVNSNQARHIQMEGTKVLQRRACYVIGADLSLLEGIDEQVESIEQQTGTGEEVYDRFHFTHYDLVWYRDKFEIDLLRRHGVHFVDLRLQHAFGVGLQGNDADPPEMNKAASSQPPHVERRENENSTKTISDLFICFRPWSHLCTMENRKNLRNRQKREEKNLRGEGEGTGEEMGGEGERVDKEDMLLLLGGRWEEWLGEPGLVDQATLSNVVFVRDGSIGNAKDLIRRASTVFIFHAGTDEDTTRTTTDVLWPFVAAAVADKRIHFLRKNDHLLSLVHDWLNTWDEDVYLRRSIVSGVDRLHGLASSIARVHVTQVQDFTCNPFDDAGDKSTAAVAGTRETDAPQCDTLRRSELAYLQAAAPHSLGVLQMRFESFELGPHGQVCMRQASPAMVPRRRSQHEGLQGEGEGEGEEGNAVLDEERKLQETTCLMRDYHYLLLVPSLGQAQDLTQITVGITWEGQAGENERDLVLEVSLRGNFYKDVIYSMNYTIPNSPQYTPQWAQQACESLRLLDTQVGVISPLIYRFELL